MTWQELLEKDDRTSPAEYPEMALITYEEFTSNVMDFARAILHGDDNHRAWLLEAAREFNAGRAVPPPRGSGGIIFSEQHLYNPKP